MQHLIAWSTDISQLVTSQSGPFEPEQGAIKLVTGTTTNVAKSPAQHPD